MAGKIANLRVFDDENGQTESFHPGCRRHHSLRRRRSRRLPVHPLCRRPQRPTTQLHRCGFSIGRRASCGALRSVARRARLSRRTGTIRRRNGGRVGERRSRYHLARLRRTANLTVMFAVDGNALRATPVIISFRTFRLQSAPYPLAILGPDRIAPDPRRQWCGAAGSRDAAVRPKNVSDRRAYGQISVRVLTERATNRSNFWEAQACSTANSAARQTTSLAANATGAAVRSRRTKRSFRQLPARRRSIRRARLRLTKAMLPQELPILDRVSNSPTGSNGRRLRRLLRHPTARSGRQSRLPVSMSPRTSPKDLGRTWPPNRSRLSRRPISRPQCRIG